MTMWVKNKGGVAQRADNLMQAYFYLGWMCARWEREHEARLTINDWPAGFDEGTYCVAYPEGKDPVGDAQCWITADMQEPRPGRARP